MKTCDINLSVDEILITIDALKILQDESIIFDSPEEDKMLDLLIDKLKICLHMAKEDE
jgi:hypothetical protein